jgi:hypothetical protein
MVGYGIRIKWPYYTWSKATLPMSTVADLDQATAKISPNSCLVTLLPGSFLIYGIRIKWPYSTWSKAILPMSTVADLDQATAKISPNSCLVTLLPGSFLIFPSVNLLTMSYFKKLQSRTCC